MLEMVIFTVWMDLQIVLMRMYPKFARLLKIMSSVVYRLLRKITREKWQYHILKVLCLRFLRRAIAVIKKAAVKVRAVISWLLIMDLVYGALSTE